MTRMIKAILVNLCFVFTVAAQAPEIVKVDPPSWWVGSSLNPERVMIRGRNLQEARIQVPGLRVGVPKINDRGTYIFVDVFITSPGKRSITVTTPNGSAQAPFEVFGPLNRTGSFQGFSPADVMYLIMIDRFADGDPSNNDGIYD